MPLTLPSSVSTRSIVREGGGDAATGRHAQLVQPGRLGPCQGRHLAVGDLTETGGRLLWLVDDGDPVRVHVLGPVEEVTDYQRIQHLAPPDAG